jgi:hypothetical protein
VVCLNSAVDDRQPEPATACFGRHEWLEEFFLDRIGDSPTLIRHTQHYCAAREVLGLRRKLVMRELGSFDPDLAARWRRLDRVEEEVEDRAMEQVIIANDDQWN